MKKYLLIVSTCFIAHNFKGQNYISAAKKDSLWGYIDEKGKTIIDFQYTYARNFSCGLAMVKKNGKYYYINTSNKSITDGSKFVAKTDFSDNRAIVLDPVSNKKMAINTKGEVIYSNPELEDMQEFYHGYSRIKIADLYGFIDTTGTIKIQPKYKYAQRFAGSDDCPLAAVKNGILWIYVRKDGREVIPPPEFEIKDYLYLIKRGSERKSKETTLILVRKSLPGDKSESESWFGYMNQEGQIVIPPVFKKANNFHEGLAAVSQDGKKWGYINSKAEWVIEPKLKSAKNFSGGLAICASEKKQFIRKDGTVACTNENFDIKSNFVNGFARVKKGDFIGFIDQNCVLRVPAVHYKTKEFSCGYLWVLTDKGWALIDGNGVLVIPPSFTDVRNFVPYSNSVAESNEPDSGEKDE